MPRQMKIQPETEPEILLWLLCVQITENDVWDDLLKGLNEKGMNDIIEFVDNVIFEIPKTAKPLSEYGFR